MQRTLLLIKPSAIQRGIVWEVVKRIENKGLIFAGMKMMQLDSALLDRHYAHLVGKSFYPSLKQSMQSSPIIACVVEGFEAVKVVRQLTGATNGRDALPGTIRGDFSMSVMENIVHTSDSVESAINEVANFFKPEELFAYRSVANDYIYASDER